MEKEKLRPMFIVADDGGLHPAIDRGIHKAAQEKAITHADYMILPPASYEAALRFKKEHPDVGIGLHIDVSGKLNDYLFTPLAYWCRWQSNLHTRSTVVRETERQLKIFQDHFGHNPNHLSVHGHLHLDHRLQPFPWFTDLIQRLLEGECSQIIVRGVHTRIIRHTHAWEQILGRPSLTPEQFGYLLKNISKVEEKPLELIVHPASAQLRGDPKLYRIYRIPLMEKDLGALIDIVRSGIISDAGYTLVGKSKP